MDERVTLKEIMEKEVMCMLFYDKINAIIEHLENHPDVKFDDWIINEERIRKLVKKELAGLENIHDFIVEHIKSRLLLRDWKLNSYKNEEV